MPFNISEEDLHLLSVRAREWVTELERSNPPLHDRDRHAIAFGKVKEELQGILLEELESAIAKTEEYNIPELKDPLIENFSKSDIIDVSYSTGNIIINTDMAGTLADFWDGINLAREALNINEESDPAKRAAFWKDFIYKPARRGELPGKLTGKKKAKAMERAQVYYDRTIGARTNAWGGLAPYWYWLEHGNYRKSGAFPRFGATNFIYNASKKMQAIYDIAFSDTLEEEGNIIVNSIQAFLANPDEYIPGQVLAKFYDQAKPYYVYVTPKRGLLGITSRLR